MVNYHWILTPMCFTNDYTILYAVEHASTYSDTVGQYLRYWWMGGLTECSRLPTSTIGTNLSEKEGHNVKSVFCVRLGSITVPASGSNDMFG